MATEKDIKEHNLSPEVNINYPPSTSYPKSETQAYWDQVQANAAVVQAMKAVSEGQKQERQVMEDEQASAAQGAALTLDRRENESKRLAGLEKAREAKRAKSGHTTPEGL